ncbi:C2 domain protein [Ancylostoma duodenale]|uniref:C2 domain protein n=1 Tax=Ancylostoma duodenale TaxID=51022 RepID=A0A0C2G2J0_9BILA|nr:C2 domain protein [Ancylostoma duodenale]
MTNYCPNIYPGLLRHHSPHCYKSNLFSDPLKTLRRLKLNPYVKLYLRKENGERIVKKKTHVRRATVNPVYNESFVFELPETKMDNAVIDLQELKTS